MNSEPIKFLIVDDVEQNLVALEALLRRDGLDVLTARSGIEALELLLTHDVALAFLDVQMPGMDGFELAELIRGTERTKRVPIIFITAAGRDSERVFQGYEFGAVDFLHKPIDPRVLKSKADVFFELSRQQRDCNHALRLTEMFVGILGHDLRTPLSAVMTGTEILALTVTEEAQRDIVRRVHLSSRRMSEMIEQLIDLTRARLAGGRGFVSARERVDMGELVRRAVDELSTTHPRREIRVTVRGDVVTAGDPARVLQALSNLIGNAIQHGRADGPVSIEVASDDRHVYVEIHNHGMIPAELVPVLFDPFRGGSVSLSRPNSRGLGLGLYIAQQIAQAHDGAVSVSSNETTGTAFTMRLPRIAAGAVGPERERSARTVLVADDDEVVRETLREALEGEGYVTVTAANGREALEYMQQARVKPAAVILDLMMPLLDGGEVYAAMRAVPELARIPVIVSTADPARAPVGTFLIAKPVKLGRLLEAVACLVRSS